MQKKRLHPIVIILVLLTSSTLVHAQSPTTSLAVKYRNLNGQTEIRWAPTDHLLFRIANRKGYQLERKNYDTQQWEVLLSRTPYSVAEFKSKLDTTDAHVATAAQAVHGQSVTIPTPNSPLKTALEMEQEQQMRYAFAMLAADYSKEAAEGLALSHIVPFSKKGRNPLYRIFIKDLEEGTASDTNYFLVNQKLVYEPRQVVKVQAESKSSQVILKWSKMENEEYFSGYFIEKSNDGGQTFDRLNEIPLVTSDSREFEEFNAFNIYSDKTVVNGTPYQYRIIGVTPFGDEGLPSEVITATGMDLAAPPPPTTISTQDMGDNTFQISWESDTRSADHAGFIVARSNNPMGPFFHLHEGTLSKETRAFIDPNPIPVKANYYLIYVLDTNGNRNGSR